MRKVILIPDSFKGTMSSKEICDILAGCIYRFFPNCTVRSVPIADGGEGSIDALLLACGGKKIPVTVSGAFFEPVRAYYALLPNGSAVVELAQCAGLPLVKERQNPALTTTYGVGEMIKQAIQNGAKEIIVALGGSATNDGGCGAAAAMGARFFNERGYEFVPTGGTLCEIKRISLGRLRERIKGVQIRTMCDVTNPMYGMDGAAYVFAPQKGADAAMVARLENGLMHLSKKIFEATGRDVSHMPGAGAAGAMGAGMAAFFGAALMPGIDTMMHLLDFSAAAKDADLVITGEGKLDAQSLNGKVVSGVAKQAKKHNIPCIAIVGGYESIPEMYSMGLSAVFALPTGPQTLSEAKRKSRENLTLLGENLMRLLKQWEK